MDAQTVNFVLALLGGSFGTAFLRLAYKFFEELRHGKVESNKTLQARIEAQSARDDQRATEAEAAEVERRAERDEARDQAAMYRRALLENNIPIPEVPKR